MFTLAAILYGDYPELADRLLSSITVTSDISDVRLGMNAVSDSTAEIVSQWATQYSRHTPVTLYWPDRNVGKYPLMRQMLYDSKAVLSRWLMWFDDDSHLQVTPAWWEQLKLKLTGCDQLGALHLIRQRGLQYQEIVKQPWYTGKPVNANTLFQFATGGWWVARSEFLRQWDYPFKALHHNGGDSILGELLRQQSGQLRSWPEGVSCGCEACRGRRLAPSAGGRVHINVGGRKGRRGIGVTGEKYVWADGCTDLDHQNFQVRIQRYVCNAT